MPQGVIAQECSSHQSFYDVNGALYPVMTWGLIPGEAPGIVGVVAVDADATENWEHSYKAGEHHGECGSLFL